MADDPTANELLLDRVIRHQVYLERFKTSELKKLIAQLDSLDDDLLAQLAKADPDTLRAKRLDALLQRVKEISAQAVERYSQALSGSLQSFGEYEAGWITAEMAKAAGVQLVVNVGLDLITPDPNLIRAAINTRPLQGKLLKEWVADISRGSYQRLAAAIRMAAIESQTIQQLVQRVRGSAATGYTDGIMQITRRGAEALARTALQHISNEARRLSFEANSGVIKKVQWVSTLDSRTTPFCRAMDGKVLELGKGPRPPAHINCRSTIVPVLVSWKDLGINAKEMEPGTRASMNGQVAATLTYDEWLRKQSTAFQDDVLGPARAALFREGGLKLERFVDLPRTRQFTLEELHQREPAAWEAVFGGKTVKVGRRG